MKYFFLRTAITIFLVFTIPVTPMALAEVHAALATNSNHQIWDSQLATLIDQHIRTKGYQSMILVFTQCYGGGFFDDFAGFSNTALLSATQVGPPLKKASYGGYHIGAASNLKPSVTTDYVHNQGIHTADPDDTPAKAGDNQTVGTSSSTHVLVWAGQPDGPHNEDQSDINRIYNNFAGQPNTTVTVLANNGNGTHVDGPATYADLEVALHNIGIQMNPNEQFIFFATSHGDSVNIKTNVLCDGDCSLTLDAPAYADMVINQWNVPSLSFTSTSLIDTGCFKSVTVNDYPLPLPPELFELDYDHDGVPDEYEYMMPVDESKLQATSNQIIIEVDKTNCGVVLFNAVGLESGAISKLTQSSSDIPTLSQWGLIIMAGLLLTAGAIVIQRRLKAVPA